MFYDINDPVISFQLQVFSFNAEGFINASKVDVNLYTVNDKLINIKRLSGEEQ